jgi:hypothetical protein
MFASLRCAKESFARPRACGTLAVPSDGLAERDERWDRENGSLVTPRQADCCRGCNAGASRAGGLRRLPVGTHTRWSGRG